ncbi:MAG: pyridoxal-phosphate dependent enzyme [Pseudomonadota bacterium]
MKMVRNPHRGRPTALVDAPFPSTNVAAVQKLLAHCPHADETPLVDAAALGPAGSLWVKDERARMGLGSFKALGAAYVIANDAAARAASPDSNTLAGETYVTASAGNHGLSVAAGARVFGAQAVVYIAETVPADFATRLGGLGAKVVRKGRDYAADAAADIDAA